MAAPGKFDRLKDCVQGVPHGGGSSAKNRAVCRCVSRFVRVGGQKYLGIGVAEEGGRLGGVGRLRD